MLLTQTILDGILLYRNTSTLLCGDKESIHTLFPLDTYREEVYQGIHYKVLQNVYYITINKLDKHKLVQVVSSLCLSFDHFGSSQKKVIVLLDFHTLNNTFQQLFKTMIDSSYLTAIFILHVSSYSKVDPNIRDRYTNFSLPPHVTSDITTANAYDKIRALGNKASKKVVDDIRELCYIYYMNHTHSTRLQTLIVQNICANLHIPSVLKMKVVSDITRLNHLYQHSYRKPIFLETMILSLCKHLGKYVKVI